MMERFEMVERVVGLIERYAQMTACECEGRRGGSFKAYHSPFCWWSAAGEALGAVCDALGVLDEEVPDFKLRRRLSVDGVVQEG